MSENTTGTAGEAAEKIYADLIIHDYVVPDYRDKATAIIQEAIDAALSCEREKHARRFTAPIVCLCGSTKFKQAWIAENARLTGEGFIVLSVGFWGHHERIAPSPEIKLQLDELHKRKIDLCDWVYVLDIGGYIGSSTKSEIEYATALGKPIKYLSQEFPDYQEPIDELVTARAACEAERKQRDEDLELLVKIATEEQIYLCAKTVDRYEGESAAELTQNTPHAGASEVLSKWRAALSDTEPPQSSGGVTTEDFQIAKIESDYRNGTLKVFLDNDADAHIAVINGLGSHGVEFCTARGGGQSPEVRRAIIELGRAIRRDALSVTEPSAEVNENGT